jgi:hypothetical protein
MYRLLAAVLIPAACFAGEPTNGPLEGVWRADEVTHGGPPVTVKPGHYSRVDVQTQETRPVLADARTATAEELRQVWGPVVAEAGMFALTEKEIILRPTVAKNPAEVSVQSDLYSLGLVLYEMYTGHRRSVGPVML